MLNRGYWELFFCLMWVLIKDVEDKAKNTNTYTPHSHTYMLSAQPWHQDMPIKPNIHVFSMYMSILYHCWNDDLLASTWSEKRGGKYVKIYVCTFSDCIMPYKNITYSTSLQDALGHNSLWDGGLILYQRRHKFHFAARLYIWTYRLFWEKIYRTTALYTEDQFGWIDSPVQCCLNWYYWAVFFLKLYVSNRLHNLWYETNYIDLITLLVIIFQIAPLTSQQFQLHFHICDWVVNHLNTK